MKYLILIMTVLIFISCQDDRTELKHIFYLHGRIIETQGIFAQSELYGPYKYNEIVTALTIDNAQMYAEVRTTETDFYTFCESISSQIDSLVNMGVAHRNISVVGASKGAVMAMYVSHLNKNNINYILLGANNDTIESYDWSLNGNILGIHEKSDNICGKNYSNWIIRSKNALRFVDIEINSQLGHGFLYTPIKDWLTPTVNWMKFQKITDN